ncbi:hypothetical protein AJ78_00664 [Emergomyces pasteurianus Ep9510]|uniref:Uncharacterized protein n=1 Tax=Emergomyces pasteurianus Ep9510 TaxID=1447872 RepID=A0A1J9PU20_9EURO|nr:hypothetical protein AJ78_00664 [Emergomyces pasteurianus Ep9510]
MFAIQSPKNGTASDQEGSSITPNILPCRIHHDGPVHISSRYWKPVFDDGNTDTATAYFRGRRLRGRRVLIPQGYQGVVASQTDPNPKLAPQNSGTRQKRDRSHEQDGTEEEEDDDDDDLEPSTTILDNQGTFSDFMVWDHEKLPATDDPFVKGVSEWIRFAEAVCVQSISLQIHA